MGFLEIFGCFNKRRPNYKSHILRLKSQRDVLDQYKETLENRFANLNNLCLKYIKENDRKNALFVLKKKALISRQISLVEAFTLKILEVISETESAKVESDVLKHLEIGSQLMNLISREIQRKELDCILESDVETVDYISSYLGMINRQYEVDDLELLQELDLLTSDFISVNEKSPRHDSFTENYNFHLDLSRLKSSPKDSHHLNSSSDHASSHKPSTINNYVKIK